jgi:hypothetical protein
MLLNCSTLFILVAHRAVDADAHLNARIILTMSVTVSVEYRSFESRISQVGLRLMMAMWWETEKEIRAVGTSVQAVNVVLLGTVCVSCREAVRHFDPILKALKKSRTNQLRRSRSRCVFVPSGKHWWLFKTLCMWFLKYLFLLSFSLTG